MTDYLVNENDWYGGTPKTGVRFPTPEELKIPLQVSQDKEMRLARIIAIKTTLNWKISKFSCDSNEKL